MALATKIGREFFKIWGKIFPKTSNLSKIFDKNTVKLSYSCMSNISTLISRGNSKNLKRNKNTEPPNCNCIKKENCPPPQGKMTNRVCSV